MKFVFPYLIALIVSAPSWGREGQILKCLGDEEKKFHLEKETGPLYDLNQRLIGELVQIPRIQINRRDYLTICTGDRGSESLKLLEQSLRRGKDLFVIPQNVRGMQRAMSEGMIDDYVEASKEILLTFISQIQTLSPTPHCLKEKIPELEKFFTEVKYLQEEMDMKQLFKGKDERILEKLKNYPLAFEQCRARLKKNPKPTSTEAPR